MNSDHMQPTEVEPAYCQINFGIDCLHNPSLIEQYFPEDLPEDWRVAYYSNDFHLLLTSPQDLTHSLSLDQAVETMALDDILEGVAQFREDIGDGFSLWFDVSKLTNDTQYALCNIQKKTSCSCHFVNLECSLSQMDEVCPAELECLFVTSGGNDLGLQDKELLCVVKNEKKIKPVELKKLIEQVRSYATSSQYKSVSLIFSSAHDALDNCRNALLLESMM